MAHRDVVPSPHPPLVNFFPDLAWLFPGSPFGMRCKVGVVCMNYQTPRLEADGLDIS